MKRLIFLLVLALVWPALIGEANNVAHRRKAFRTSAAPTPDLLFLKFNENTGTAWGDDGPLNEDATHDAGWGTAHGGASSADFDGTDDNGTSDSTVTWGTDKITIAFWMYPDSTTGDRVIWAMGADPFGAGSVNTANIFFSGGFLQVDVTASGGKRREYCTAPATGAWVHVLVVADNSTTSGDVAIYLDGVSQSTTISIDTKTTTANYATQNYYIGQRGSGASMFFDGRLDALEVHTGDKSADATAIMNRAE